MEMIESLPLWMTAPIAWLLLGVFAELLVTMANAIISKEGRTDLWLREEKPIMRHGFPLLGGLFSFLFCGVAMLTELRSIGILFKRKPKPTKGNKK